MQAVERGAQLDLAERPREVHVAEHLVRLERLVAASDEHRVGVVAHELEPVEVGDDRRHGESEDALPGELARRCAGGRLQLEVLERELHATKLLGQACARARGVVRDEAERVARLAQLGDGVDGARDGLSRDVEHAVDVQQNAGHGA